MNTDHFPICELSEDTIQTQYRQRREQLGLTQRELASLVGTKQAVISNIENTNYNRNTLTSLSRVAKALGMELKLSLQPLDLDK